MFRQKVARVITPEWVLVGAGTAILLVLFASPWYDAATHTDLFALPEWLGDKHVNLHFLANEMLMPFFFAIAAKEVRESLLPGGALHGRSRALLPLVATAGGVIVPAALFVGISVTLSLGITKGFVVPTATDIAFALLAARLLLGGSTHPAVTLLLTIAVVDDGIGLVMIPLVYSGGVNWLAFVGLLLLVFGAAWLFRGLGIKKWYWYIGIIGGISWLGFLWLGVEPAMALVPVVLAMPHGATDLGFLSPRELYQHDSLSEMEHAVAPWTGVILLVFGFANAGITLTPPDSTAWTILTALIVGKIVGVLGFAYVGMRCGMQLPAGMQFKQLPIVAAIAGIGFTVAVFVAGVAFDGEVASQAKMGALLSLPVGLLIAFIMTRVLGVRK